MRVYLITISVNVNNNYFKKRNFKIIVSQNNKKIFKFIR